MLGQIKTLERELNEGINLLTTETPSIAASLKALEADDQDAGQPVDLHCLSRLYELLALIAVPLVLLVKHLRLLELLEALAKLDLTALVGAVVLIGGTRDALSRL